MSCFLCHSLSLLISEHAHSFFVGQATAIPRPFFSLSSLILLSPGLLLNKSQGTFISFLICSINTIAMMSVLVVAWGRYLYCRALQICG